MKYSPMRTENIRELKIILFTICKDFLQTFEISFVDVVIKEN